MRTLRYGFYALLFQLTGCSDYSMSKLQNAPLQSRTVFQRKAQVALREAADALSDSNHRGVKGPGSAGFRLQDIVQQTCTNQADGAMISIKSAQTSSFAMDSLEKSYQKDVFVNAEVERTYTLVGEDLECARKQAIIEVDLDRELVNLQLDVKHRREEKTYISELVKAPAQETAKAGAPAQETAKAGADEAAQAEPAAAETAKAGAAGDSKTAAGESPTDTTADTSDGESVAVPPPSRQMTAITSRVEGTRKVTFTAALGEVKDDVSYSKESQGTSTRRETVQSTENGDQDLNFTVQSQFKMVDTYDEDARDRAVGQGPIRKEITEGTVKSVLAGQGSVETTFTNLKLEFSQGVCKAVSGKIQSRFLNEGESSPHKTVDFDVASGSVKVTVMVASDSTDPLMDRADILSSMDLQKELCTQDAFLD